MRCEGRVMRRLGAMAMVCVAALTACLPSKSVKRVVPGVSTGAFSESSAADLSVLVICHDTLGRPDRASRGAVVSRCSPCLPRGAEASDARSIAHARRLWAQVRRAPYDTTDLGAQCAALAYRFAQSLRPHDDSLAAEVALFKLHDIRDSVRRQTLIAFDSLVGARRRTSTVDASALLMYFALGVWDRAQRLLERPAEIGMDRRETRVRRFANTPPVFTHLPPLPPVSPKTGVSEAEWAARLFTRAAELATPARPAQRSRALRLALAPWVTMERWTQVDSAAQALLAMAPSDSAVLPVRALAFYRSMTHPLATQAEAMTRFEQALRHMPRADSVRYDSFDDVLGARDDEWRYGFLPDIRREMDARGWSVLDPMWSTPVNEIRLERRARIADADYRYADIAAPGEAGSETRSGAMLLRRGAPDARWTAAAPRRDGRRRVTRGWGDWQVVIEFESGREIWRAFHGQSTDADHASRFPFPESRSCRRFTEMHPTLWACALAEPASWSGVPFYGILDEVDVSLARFRAAGDSADLYLGARVPYRRFASRGDASVRKDDRLTFTLFLSSLTGTPIYQSAQSRPLPSAAEIAWTTQWHTRTGSLSLMHRVEAVELRRPSGARGVARATSDSMVSFPLRGFGMSDILLADTLRINAPGASSGSPDVRDVMRWHDVEVVPNAAVVRPGQRFSMLWEVYDLVPGPDGRISWRVSIRREKGVALPYADMQSVLAGQPRAIAKVAAVESDAPDVSYTRSAQAVPVIVDHLRFGLNDAPEGRHVVQVTIDDLVSGLSTRRSVVVRVLDPRTQRRTGGGDGGGDGGARRPTP